MSCAAQAREVVVQGRVASCMWQHWYYAPAGQGRQLGQGRPINPAGDKGRLASQAWAIEGSKGKGVFAQPGLQRRCCRGRVHARLCVARDAMPEARACPPWSCHPPCITLAAWVGHAACPPSGPATDGGGGEAAEHSGTVPRECVTMIHPAALPQQSQGACPTLPVPPSPPAVGPD